VQRVKFKECGSELFQCPFIITKLCGYRAVVLIPVRAHYILCQQYESPVCPIGYITVTLKSIFRHLAPESESDEESALLSDSDDEGEDPDEHPD